MGIEKRKTSLDEDEDDEEDQRAKSRRRKKKEPDPQAVAAVVPTEDEVEEFFAIVRRMQVAVKYFEKSAGAGKGVGAAAESEAAVNSDAGDRVGPAIAAGERKESNGGLDLNAEPEMDDQDRR